MKAITNFFHSRTPKPKAAPSAPLPTAGKSTRSQSPEQMLKILKNAELRRQRVGIDRTTGDLSPRSGSRWDFFKTLFSKKPVGIENRDEIVGAVIKKMKDHIHKSTEHVDQAITKFLPDLGHFAQTGEIGDLQNQWSRLQNILRQGIEDFERQQCARMESIETPSVKTTRSVRDKPVSSAQNRYEKSARTKNTTGENHAAMLISATNNSLPAAMPPITRVGETVRCTLTVPVESQMQLFSDLPEWDLHKRNAVAAKDHYVGLSEAFFKDSERATYVFETDGFPIECERESEAVAIGFKKTAGPNPSRQYLLSHLLGQEALKNMLDLVERSNPRRDGNHFLSPSGESSPAHSQNKIHMSTLANGDVEVAFLILKKTTFLPADQGLICINRSKKFNGPPCPENAGMCTTMKIRISGASLDRGQLKFSIVEPLTSALQIEIAENQDS